MKTVRRLLLVLGLGALAYYLWGCYQEGRAAVGGTVSGTTRPGGGGVTNNPIFTGTIQAGDTNVGIGTGGTPFQDLFLQNLWLQSDSGYYLVVNAGTGMPASVFWDFPATNAVTGQVLHGTTDGRTYWATPAGGGGSSNFVTASFGSQDTTNRALMRGGLTVTNGVSFNLAEIGTNGTLTIVNSNTVALRVVSNSKEMLVVSNDSPNNIYGPGSITLYPTMPTGNTGVGLSILATNNNSPNSATYALKLRYEGSGTPTGTTVGGEFDIATAGSAANLGTLAAMYGVAGDALGNGVGANIGAHGYAERGGFNLGVVGNAGYTDDNLATNVGGLFFSSRLGGTSVKHFGVMAVLGKPVNQHANSFFSNKPETAVFADVATNLHGAPTWMFIGASNGVPLFGVFQDGRVTIGPSTNLSSAYLNVHSGGMSLGVNGGVLTNVLYAAATLDFPSTVQQNHSDLGIVLSGAANGDIVSIGVPLECYTEDCVYTGFASNGLVVVRFYNGGAISQNPVSGTFKVRVDKFQ